MKDYDRSSRIRSTSGLQFGRGQTRINELKRDLMMKLNRIGKKFLLLAFLAFNSAIGQELTDTSQAVSFNRHIRPLFAKHCIGCHGGVKQAAGLSFVFESGVVGEDGWVIEPGDPNDSLLIQRVTATDPDLLMPPVDHGERLDARDVKLLKQWILEGAKWENHWSFIKPARQPRPDVKNKDWPSNPIDYYVLAQLEKKGIEPSAEAPAERWLRRVTLDLIGLPPTVEECAEFLRQVEEADDENALEAVYQSTVERLLNSPGYGERWASVWLDQVRYADSKGLGTDSRRNIWKYRDWVIDSFNRDLSFDQFTIKQLAGDLLEEPAMEDLIATAIHRLTQTNDEGGTDDEEFRVAAVLDRVNTTWQAWQGVTFACAQCHSHPYDPIVHEEYYQFASFFNNTLDSDLGEEWPKINVPLDTSQYGSAMELDGRIERLEREIWHSDYNVLNRKSNWHSVENLEATTNNETQVGVEKVGGNEQFHTIDTVSRNTQFTLNATAPKSLKTISAVKLTALPLEPEKAIRDSEWGFVLSHINVRLLQPGREPIPLKINRVVIDEPHPFFDPQLSLDEKSNRGFSAYTRINYPRSAAFVLDAPVSVSEADRIEVVLSNRVFILAAFPLVIRRGYIELSDTDQFVKIASETNRTDQLQQLDRLKRERKEIQSTSLPIMKERLPRFARTQHVFVRGLFLDKDKKVDSRLPAALTDSPPQKINRLDMAKWIASSRNPLTARVIVNRIWSRLFGSGLVATEEDFGSSGDPPTHPLLLDRLAVDLQTEWNWSLKRLIKQIVLSKTYRQSSVYRQDLKDLDPGNRWLARGPRHRLAAEIIRDQALMVSGLLSRKKFGPPVHPPIPAGVWRPFSGGDKWSTPPPEKEDRYRRSIYTYTKRSIPYPMFAAFDSPSREFCQPRRLRSNTPVQALMLMNDQTFSECNVSFANRMIAAADNDVERLSWGFLAVTCRNPRPDELEALQKLIGKYATEPETAAYQAVASVLLNLDEVVTK